VLERERDPRLLAEATHERIIALAVLHFVVELRVRRTIDKPLVSHAKFVEDARHDVRDGEVLKNSIVTSQRE
jgi:hypothetical protein